MTLRTIEQRFSDEILYERKQEKSFDLTLNGPIFSHVHPGIVKANLKFETDPNLEPFLNQIPGWHYDCFPNLEEAKKKYPHLSIFSGKWFGMDEFFCSEKSDAIIDFFHLGSLVISKNPLIPEPTKKLYWHVLPIWASYALSPELSGPGGKVIRFHERLTNIFEEKKLLNGSCFKGYYPLKCSSAKIEEFGFCGTVWDGSYLLVLPWDFPLTGLEKLERTISQEF